MKILLIEDDKEISKSIAFFLKEKGYQTEVIHDGLIGLELAQRNHYGAIILDYNLPHLNGWEIVCKLRKEKNMIPIIMLTVRNELEEKIKLLEAGADDYLTKPFSLSELLARLKAITRRPREIKNNYLRVKNLTLYPDQFLVKKDKENIRLKYKEFALLQYLMENKGFYKSRQDILDNVWDENADPFSNTVEVHIMKIRKKIETNNDKYIYTVSNRGYKIDSQI
ncbi:MAG: response regulator transcription factor [Patescibacteria group bacterium]|nr:response regulator transcription factor [Patescibacteria group bacterium]MDD3778063.1 response regulator transcription factor [Patescibacteria group bacterium]MDD3939562.1 response regulator transcription factor [Patescibacteria group bacterium]MDD4443852.1 response regulator transcription factor [Patescibacteria group bacterium]NCU39554.1 response regulator transcription factor [Candidatus Falkowbacteria bacterium]